MLALGLVITLYLSPMTHHTAKSHAPSLSSYATCSRSFHVGETGGDWAIVAVPRDLGVTDASQIRLPDVGLDESINLTNAQTTTLKAELDKKGITTTTVTKSMTFRSLVKLIGGVLEQGYNDQMAESLFAEFPPQC